MIVFDQYLYPEKPDVDDDVLVYHSGFCSTEPNYSYGKDIRDYYLIHYITGGKGTYSVDGKTYHLSTHDGFLILPYDTIIHKADADDPWDLCWVAFFGRKIDSLLKSAGLGRDMLLFRYEEDDFLENCIKEIYNESRNNQNIAKIHGYFYLFIGKLIEIYETTQRKKKKEIVTFSHYENAMNYIKRNLSTQINIENLANYMHLDTSQVYRVIKEKTGISPKQLITKLRIEKACEMLSKTDLSIKEISEWLDFEYQSHFTKQFKKFMGVPPSEFQREIQQRNHETPDGRSKTQVVKL